MEYIDLLLKEALKTKYHTCFHCGQIHNEDDMVLLHLNKDNQSEITDGHIPTWFCNKHVYEKCELCNKYSIDDICDCITKY
jgi:hypothetical protein